MSGRVRTERMKRYYELLGKGIMPPVAFISLPDYNTPVEGIFTNMNGYWNPPDCVLSFSAHSCIVEYTTEEQFEKDKVDMEASYMEMISQFYRDNAL